MLDFEEYLERLASAAPTPGGGSAACFVGAMSAALVAMVARITAGAEKFHAIREPAGVIASGADTLRARFLAARPIDEAAYGAVVAAQSLPRQTAAERTARTERLQAALRLAAEAPLVAAGLAADAISLCEAAAGLHNDQLSSDIECALSFARAALDAGVANVRINHRYLNDAGIVGAQRERLSEIVAAASIAEVRVHMLLPAPRE
ncbi:MAG: cyclodeaminase/cyclohydrolase family protein [Candidatus Velthaea sp.]